MLAAALLAVAGCGGTPDVDRDSGRPSLFARMPLQNVLVVSFDALRADHLGLYGYPRRTSPAIDAFGESAVVFEQAWSPSSATPTSFAGMWSGAVPSRVFLGWKLVETPTLAGWLSRAGYSTAFFSNNTQLVATRGFDRGFSTYDVVAGSAAVDGDGDGVADDEVILNRAIEWLQAVDSPFFVWVHFLSPHSPYRMRSMSSHLYEPSYRGPFETTSGHSFEAASEADLRRLIDLYDGEIYFADRLFESVLAALEESHGDSTVVVLTADHGEEFLEHGGLQHGGVHEEVVRVPFAIRARGTPPRRISEPVSLLDLAPTLAAVVGVEPFPEATGRSIETEPGPDRLRVALSMTHRTDHFVAAARGPNKLSLDCRRQRRRLFDLERDAGELHDLAAQEPQRVRRLARDLGRVLGGPPCLTVARAVRGVSPTESVGGEERKTLLALGYLGSGSASAIGGGRTESGRLWADPDPVPDCDGDGLGSTTLHWRFPPEWGAVEVRVEPGGRLFAVASGSGRAASGRWVTDGLRFVARVPVADGPYVVEIELDRRSCRGSGTGS